MAGAPGYRNGVIATAVYQYRQPQEDDDDGEARDAHSEPASVPVRRTGHPFWGWLVTIDELAGRKVADRYQLEVIGVGTGLASR